MAKVLTKRRLGLFVLFLLITAGLAMPATADKKTRVKKTRVPTEQIPDLLIGQWKGSFVFGIPQISLDITSVQGGKIRGVGHEFGSKCTGPYEIRGKITEKGWIIYTRLPTESCPELVFKLKMFRTKTGDLLIASWGSWRGPAKTYKPGLIRVSATPGAVRQPSKAAPAPTTTATLKASRATPYRIGVFPCGGNFGSGAYNLRDDQVARVLQTNIKKNPALGEARKKPNQEVVYRLARERGLDGVVMCWTRSSGFNYSTSRRIDLYLIDVERRQVYRQKGTTKASTVRTLTKRVFADFIKGRGATE